MYLIPVLIGWTADNQGQGVAPSRWHELIRGQETERLVADPAPGITAAPHDDNLRYFDVTIEGPGGSPFEREDLYSPSLATELDTIGSRGHFQAGIVSARGISHGATESEILNEDIPP